jgi:hypothetical protein
LGVSHRETANSSKEKAPTGDIGGDGRRGFSRRNDETAMIRTLALVEPEAIVSKVWQLN